MTSSAPQQVPKRPSCHATSCPPPPASRPPGTDRRAWVASRMSPSKVLERVSLCGRRLGEQS
eukprot:1781282-Alexandrium_andersonii.AAC.1